MWLLPALTKWGSQQKGFCFSLKNKTHINISRSWKKKKMWRYSKHLPSRHLTIDVWFYWGHNPEVWILIIVLQNVLLWWVRLLFVLLLSRQSVKISASYLCGTLYCLPSYFLYMKKNTRRSNPRAANVAACTDVSTSISAGWVAPATFTNRQCSLLYLH